MNLSIFIKICGLTRLDDVQFAIDSGVGAIGFIGFPKSPRYITPSMVADILSKTKNSNGIKKVGVFVNASLDEIQAYIDVGINTIQLHGDETAEFAHRCNTNCEVWKVIKPQSLNDIRLNSNFPADKFVLDTFHKKLRGGTGEVIDNKLAQFAAEHLPKPLILAGGLSPDNCMEISNRVNPFGIDVNSGVETSPGIKDPNLIEALINRYKVKGI